MSYCTTLTAINSLMSGTHVALLNISQMSKGKSANSPVLKDRWATVFIFFPLVPSSKICKDNYSVKYACQRQASPTSSDRELGVGGAVHRSQLYHDLICKTRYLSGKHTWAYGAHHATQTQQPNRCCALHCPAPSPLDLSSLGQG